MLKAALAVATVSITLSGAVAKDAAITELTAANFEHLTQAASGATTGDWLVHFDLDRGDIIPAVLEAAAPELRERGIIAAHVNCADSANAAWCRRRFDVARHPKLGASELIALFSKGYRTSIRALVPE